MRTHTKQRRRTAVAASALAMMAVVTTACPPDAPVASPPCSRGASAEVDGPITHTGVVPPGLPPGIDLGYDGRPIAEATSANGAVHAWIVAERQLMDLVAYSTKGLRVYAQDTTSDDPPVEVHRFDMYSGLYGSFPTLDPNGVPFDANLDVIADDGSGAQISVTYGRYRPMGFFGVYIDEPYRTFTFELAC